MKNISVTLTLLFVSLCCGISPAQSQTPVDPNKTQVIIIGTLHKFHYDSPKYKPEVLREIILSLKPDAILNELPLDQVDPNGRPTLDLRHYIQCPECWAADTVAQQLVIKQIPFDRPDREENFRKTNYFEREKQSDKLSEKWAEQIRKEDPNSIDLKIFQLGQYAANAQAEMWKMNLGPEVFNSELFDLIIRIKHSVNSDITGSIFKKYPGYESLADFCKFHGDQWLERNKIMAENIKKAAKEYPGRRLVVLTGGEHRYILRDLLKNESCIDLKEYWELINFDVDKCLKSLPPPPIPEMGIFADGLTKEQASQKVAKEYWEAVIDKNWELVNKLRPPVAGVNWQEKHSQNMPVELLKVKEAFWLEDQPFGPLAPCVVKFADGKIFEINIISQFRTIRGKTMCFISGTWGKHREINNTDNKLQEPNQPAYLKVVPPDTAKGVDTPLQFTLNLIKKEPAAEHKK